MKSEKFLNLISEKSVYDVAKIEKNECLACFILNYRDAMCNIYAFDVVCCEQCPQSTILISHSNNIKKNCADNKCSYTLRQNYHVP